jgi:5,5'-dehydrodivanillate O-demethylase
VFKNGMVDEHPILFPNVLRHGNGTQIRVPIDDTHTMIVFVHFIPGDIGGAMEEDEDSIPVRYRQPYKDPPHALHPFTRFDMNQGQQQDHMAWETQGPITDRTAEHISYSDKGIVMYRRMLLDNIERVEQGLEPLGVVRDSDHPIIDTNLNQDLEESRRGRLHRRPPIPGSGGLHDH